MHTYIYTHTLIFYIYAHTRICIYVCGCVRYWSMEFELNTQSDNSHDAL